MPIWKHSDTIDSDLLWLAPTGSNVCLFCETRLQTWDIEDLWPQEDYFYLNVHQRMMFGGEDSFVEIHGLHDEPETWKVETGSPSEMFVSASMCPACGWWSFDKQVTIDAPRQIWDLFFRTQGVLLSLDLADIHVPLDEVRKFLLAKYESRFSIHPRNLEEVIASVFRNLGYEAIVTAYSGDGGIDVILIGRKGERVGVQVKRYQGRIEVEQIRSFIGALMLGRFTAGVFVTTSRYQSGAFALAQQAGEICVPIKLVDAGAFFEALRIAQLLDSDEASDFPYFLKSNPLPLLHFTCEHHRNSL